LSNSHRCQSIEICCCWSRPVETSRSRRGHRYSVSGIGRKSIVDGRQCKRVQSRSVNADERPGVDKWRRDHHGLDRAVVAGKPLINTAPELPAVVRIIDAETVCRGINPRTVEHELLHDQCPVGEVIAYFLPREGSDVAVRHRGGALRRKKSRCEQNDRRDEGN